MRPRPVPLAVLLLLAAVGCEQGDEPGLADLTPGERLYVERMVVLERAKAVGLADRGQGNALLDSLAAAWGDSSLEGPSPGSLTIRSAPPRWAACFRASCWPSRIPWSCAPPRPPGGTAAAAGFRAGPGRAGRGRLTGAASARSPSTRPARPRRS